MGTKTVQRLVILIAIVAVAGPSIYFLQRSQVTRMAKSVLEEAQEAEKGGDNEAAIEKYQEHLMVVPGDEVTKEKLADVMRKGGKDFAAGASRPALRRDPDAEPPAGRHSPPAGGAVHRAVAIQGARTERGDPPQEPTTSRTAICISC